MQLRFKMSRELILKLNYDNNVVGYVGMTAPTATVGKAKIYIDSADGDLKIILVMEL